MKKVYSVIAVLLIVCSLCACGKKSTKDPGIQAVADAVGASIDISGMAQTPDDYVTGMMQIPLDGYKARNTLISGVGTNINEYGIFLAKDKDQAASIKKALESYLDYREELWMDEYLPEEKPKLDNAEVWQQGNYVMYAILSDADREAVHNAFQSCFEG